MSTTTLLNYVPKPDGGATILLYGDVGPWGEIDSQRVVSELLALEGRYTHIDVRINSNGGDVFTGIAIYNALRASKAPITIYVDGVAASIAGIIALCGKPLYLSRYARLMLHKVSGGAYGSAKDLRRTASLIEELEGSLSEMISERVGKTKEEVIEAYFADEEDHWVSAQEAVALGMADGLYDGEEPMPLTASSTAEEIYNAFNNRLSEATNKTDMALFEQIKTIPRFSAMTEATLVQQLREDAVKLESQEQAITSLKAQVAELQAKELEAILNSAVQDGRISEEQKPHFLALLKSDRASAEAVLESMPKPTAKASTYPKAKSFTEPSGSASPYAGKTWAELDRQGLLAQYKDEDPDGFAQAYKAEFGAEYIF